MPMDSHDNSKQTAKNNTFRQSLGHALNGLKALITFERNFRFHLVFGTLAVLLGAWLQVSINDWLWLILAIALVLTAEIVNTIVEAVVDLIVGTTYHDLAKRAKDVAAGGVLLAAVFAIIVALLVLVPAMAQHF